MSHPLHCLAGILLACLFAQNLAAATPTEIYARASRNVLLLEGRDAQGAFQIQASAVALSDAVVVTQCDLLIGAQAWQVTQERHDYVAYPRERDEARNLCRLDVPGLRAAGLDIVRLDQVRVGQRVYAVGNALGLGLSLSEGLVSGIRDLGGEAWIQTTAPLAPGSEGGALFDAQGRLLGLTDYRKRDGQNINFAAPAAWLPDIAERAERADASAKDATKWRHEATRLAAADGADWKALAKLAADWSRQQPERGEPWLWLGVANEGLQDSAAAVDAFEKALLRTPESVSLALALVRNQLRLNQLDQALQVLRQALARSREEADLWFAQGVVEERQGNQDAAGQSFREALRLDPRHEASWGKQHDRARARGDRQAAQQAAARLTEIAPKHVGYWLLLAQAHVQMGRPARALSAIDRAAEIAPDNGDVLIARGAALSALRAYGEAIAVLKRGLAAQPLRPDQGWHHLGNAYYQVNLFPEAIAALREAVRLAPEQLVYQADLGVTLKDANHDAAALELFQALRDKTPQEAFPWRQIGFVQAKMGRYGEAIPALEQSLRLAPDQAKVWHALGETYAHAGRADDMRRVYQRLRGLNAERAEQFYRAFLLPAEVQP